jgi:ATP-dependent DNA helicase RecG
MPRASDVRDAHGEQYLPRSMSEGEFWARFPEESTTIEFKQGLDRDLQKTFVALANSRGGTVIVGIAPRGSERIIGVESIRDFEERINDRASSSYPPLRVETHYSSVRGLKIAFLRVAPLGEREWAQTSDGCVLERMGRVDRRLFGLELQRFILGRAMDLIETRVVSDATPGDLDRSLLRDYLREWLNRSRIRSIAEEARRANLLTPSDEVPLATMLLFGKDPQRWCPRFGISILQFSGERASGEDFRTCIEVRGPLLTLIDQVLDYFYEHLSADAGALGGDRTRRILGALREALVNAVGHRDYSLVGATIQVRLYDDLVEIESPGAPAGRVTIDNLTSTQYSRNPIIMRTLERLNMAQQACEGSNRMINYMKEAQLAVPEFDESSQSFVARLWLKPS